MITGVTCRRLFFSLLLLSCLRATADTTVKRLAPGITLTQEIDKQTPLVINVVDIDLHALGVHVGVGIAQDKISGSDPSHGREAVSRFARRRGTLVAVNADFFPFTGDPLGVGIKDGELFSEPWAGKGSPRVALGVRPDGRTILLDSVAFLGDLQAQDGARFPLSGVNRVPGPNEIVADLPIYGPNAVGRANGASAVLLPLSGPMRANTLLVGRVQTVAVGGPLLTPIDPGGAVLCAGPGAGRDFLNLHVHPGEKVGFVVGVAPPGQTGDALRIAASSLPSRGGFSRAASVWTNVRQAVGGGPRLLLNGMTMIDGVAEGFDASFTDQLNPRTAVGTSRDGRHLVLVTVEGRQAVSRGVTLADLAGICKRYGVWNAINLDGGGSTTLSVAGLVMGNPNGEGVERPVADMLTVDSDRAFYTVGAQAAPSSQVVPEASEAGGQTVLPTTSLLVGQSTLLKISGKSVLWQGMVAGGVGFVTQKGFFLATKPGAGTVTALVDGQYVLLPVTVLPKAVPVPLSSFKLTTTLGSGDAPNRSTLTLHIADTQGRPAVNARVTITVTGGTADAPFVVTDEDGSASVSVTWDIPTGGSVALQAGNGASAVVVRPVAP